MFVWTITQCSRSVVAATLGWMIASPTGWPEGCRARKSAFPAGSSGAPAGARRNWGAVPGVSLSLVAQPRANLQNASGVQRHGRTTGCAEGLGADWLGAVGRIENNWAGIEFLDYPAAAGSVKYEVCETFHPICIRSAG